MRFRDITLEMRVSNQFREVGASSRVAEKTLGEKEDKLQETGSVHVAERHQWMNRLTGLRKSR